MTNAPTRGSLGRRGPDILVAFTLCFAAGSCGSSGAPLDPGAAGTGGAPADGGAAGAAAGTGGAGAGTDGGAPGTDAGAAGAGGGAGSPSADAGPPPTPIEIAVTPTMETRRATTDCTATTATAASPLVVDRTVSCKEGGALSALAAGPAGAAFAAVAGAKADGSSRVISFNAAGALTVAAGPPNLAFVGLLAQPTGDVDLVALGRDDGLNFFGATTGGWMREQVVPPTNPMIRFEEGWGLNGAGRAADGSIQIAYSHIIDLGAEANLVTRTPAGRWSRVPLPFRSYMTSPLVVPGTGAPIIVEDVSPGSAAPTTIDLATWSNGAEAPLISLPRMPDLSDYAESLRGASVSGRNVAASFQTRRQGVVVVRPAGATPRTVALTGTKEAAPVGCPPLPSMPTKETPRVPCSEAGVGGGRSHVLAAAADGTLWVAYPLVHVDRDLAQFCVRNFAGDGFDCGAEITKDRTTSELVVEHVAANGTHAIVWRASMGPGEGGPFYIDARDARLHVAFGPASTAMGGPTFTFRYVVIDTKGL